MFDISKYTSTNKIKEVLTYVYVHMVDGQKVAVATDTFRIAQVKINGLLAESIECGFYSKKSWKEITKLLNKNTLLVHKEVIDIVKKEMSVQPEEDFPNYLSIIPKEEDCEDFNGYFSINGDFLCDLIKDVQNKKYKMFDFFNLKKHERKIIYRDDESIIMIMEMIK